MREIPLSDYVAEHGQTTTAKRLGLTQGSIWQILRSPRQIYVIEHGDGSLSYAYEKKPIGRFKPDSVA